MASDTCRADELSKQRCRPPQRKNITAIQACGSGGLFATIVAVIVSAVIPHIKLSPYSHADKGYHFHFAFSPISTIRRGSSRGLSVLAAIFRDLLFALVKPLHYRRSP
jgi:hypothetical protein